MPRTIVDAQIHLWERESPDRPWPDYGRAYAHGEELTAAQDYPERFAVMGRFPIEDPAQGDALANWRETPRMLGVRLTFRNEVQKPWLTDGTADWFWREAERVGIPVMVFVPGSLPGVAVIAERHPDLKLVIDHLSLFGVLDEAIFEQLPQVLDLARFSNVAVKTSCMPSFVSETYPYPTLQRAIRQVVQAFGPRRTFWGSDISRLSLSPDRQRAPVHGGVPIPVRRRSGLDHGSRHR